MKHLVTLIPGDGIGPEVTAATLRVLSAAGVDITWERFPAGAQALAEHGTTLPDALLSSIRRTRVALKGPVTTPVGGGFTSVNVGLRKALDLYANVRPVKSIPGVRTRYENVDLVVVRENTEDLYSGLEHVVVPGVVESLKVITRARLDPYCPVCLRLRPQARPPESHGRPQGQHHETFGRAVSGLLPQGRPALPGSAARRKNRGQHVHAARHAARTL
jgi:hypothetical protein